MLDEINKVRDYSESSLVWISNCVEYHQRTDYCGNHSNCLTNYSRHNPNSELCMIGFPTSLWDWLWWGHHSGLHPSPFLMNPVCLGWLCIPSMICWYSRWSVSHSLRNSIPIALAISRAIFVESSNVSTMLVMSNFHSPSSSECPWISYSRCVVVVLFPSESVSVSLHLWYLK